MLLVASPSSRIRTPCLLPQTKYHTVDRSNDRVGLGLRGRVNDRAVAHQFVSHIALIIGVPQSLISETLRSSKTSLCSNVNLVNLS